MAIRDIRIIGDPILRTQCDPITDIDASVKLLVEDLLEGVDMEGRAGLAANQIGVGLRAFSWNIDGEIGYVLNPKIVEVSADEFQDGDEGCLSVPDLWYPTERAWYARCSGGFGRVWRWCEGCVERTPFLGAFLVVFVFLDGGVV
ncbi:peptide deformylase [Schaalia turicensis]